MKKFTLRYCRIAFALLACLAGYTALAADEAPAAPTTDERIAALEAYVNNTDPGKSLAGVPGPGHNGWMMTCAALVLFMTLPGLALFYGGLVRKKNVLSVLAQCLGITGLVTILWWAFGYSLVFGTNYGSPNSPPPRNAPTKNAHTTPPFPQVTPPPRLSQH